MVILACQLNTSSSAGVFLFFFLRFRRNITIYFLESNFEAFNVVLTLESVDKIMKLCKCLQSPRSSKSTRAIFPYERTIAGHIFMRLQRSYGNRPLDCLFWKLNSKGRSFAELNEVLKRNIGFVIAFKTSLISHCISHCQWTWVTFSDRLCMRWKRQEMKYHLRYLKWIL